MNAYFKYISSLYYDGIQMIICGSQTINLQIELRQNNAYTI